MDKPGFFNDVLVYREVIRRNPKAVPLLFDSDQIKAFKYYLSWKKDLPDLEDLARDICNKRKSSDAVDAGEPAAKRLAQEEAAPESTNSRPKRAKPVRTRPLAEKQESSSTSLDSEGIDGAKKAAVKPENDDELAADCTIPVYTVSSDDEKPTFDEVGQALRQQRKEASNPVPEERGSSSSWSPDSDFAAEVQRMGKKFLEKKTELDAMIAATYKREAEEEKAKLALQANVEDVKKPEVEEKKEAATKLKPGRGKSVCPARFMPKKMESSSSSDHPSKDDAEKVGNKILDGTIMAALLKMEEEEQKEKKDLQSGADDVKENPRVFAKSVTPPKRAKTVVPRRIPKKQESSAESSDSEGDKDAKKASAVAARKTSNPRPMRGKSVARVPAQLAKKKQESSNESKADDGAEKAPSVAATKTSSPHPMRAKTVLPRRIPKKQESSAESSDSEGDKDAKKAPAVATPKTSNPRPMRGKSVLPRRIPKKQESSSANLDSEGDNDAEKAPAVVAPKTSSPRPKRGKSVVPVKLAKKKQESPSESKTEDGAEKTAPKPTSPTKKTSSAGKRAKTVAPKKKKNIQRVFCTRKRPEPEAPVKKTKGKNLTAVNDK